MLKTSVLIVAATLGFGGASTFAIWGGGTEISSRVAYSSIQGFGAEATGGDPNFTLQVTSLADDGPGSLRWAVEDHTDPRVVAFSVSGEIQLESQIEVGSNISILGQTSSEGVTLVGGRLRVIGSDVVVQGLRIRPGNGPGSDMESRDAISIGKSGVAIQNVVIDGNSLSWAVDENLAIWGDVSDVTISNNIIAHALDEAGHPKGSHSMGLLIGGGDVSRVSVIGNLFAHNKQRNPAIKDESQEIEFINNVVYNWGDNGFTADDSLVHILGNVFVAGGDSVDRAPIALRNVDETQVSYYVHDNRGGVRGGAKVAEAGLFDGSDAEVLPASQVHEWVLSGVGARTPELDDVDVELIADVRQSKGRIVNAPDEIGTPRPPKENAATSD